MVDVEPVEAAHPRGAILGGQSQQDEEGQTAQSEGTPAAAPQDPEPPPLRPAAAHLTGGRSETEVPLLREVTAGHLVACHLTAAQRAEQWGLLSAGQVPEAASESAPRDPTSQDPTSQDPTPQDSTPQDPTSEGRGET